LSQSAKIEIVIFAKSLLRFISAAITGCCWIKWLYNCPCYCCSYARCTAFSTI